MDIYALPSAYDFVEKTTLYFTHIFPALISVFWTLAIRTQVQHGHRCFSSVFGAPEKHSQIALTCALQCSLSIAHNNLAQVQHEHICFPSAFDFADNQSQIAHTCALQCSLCIGHSKLAQVHHAHTCMSFGGSGTFHFAK